MKLATVPIGGICFFLSNWSCPPSQDWFTPGDTTQLQQTGAGPQRYGREKLQGTCPSQRVQCESKFLFQFSKVHVLIQNTLQ